MADSHLKSFNLYHLDQVVPTALSCSQGGNILAAAFTDDKIRILDFRVPPPKGSKQDSTMLLEGEHTDLVKQLALSPDGTVLLSAGQDCVVKVWDLGTRRCLQTIG